MQAIIKRLIAIAFCLIVSSAFIYRTKARSPYSVPKIDYKVACIPAPSSKQEEDKIDEKLKAVFDYAHTTQEPQESEVKSYRCYFRFPSTDIACMPPKDAKRINKVQHCPRYIHSEEKSCYFLDRKYHGFLSILNANPPVSKNLYKGKVVKDWKKVRDVLLGK